MNNNSVITIEQLPKTHRATHAEQASRVYAAYEDGCMDEQTVPTLRGFARWIQMNPDMVQSL